MDSRRAQAGAPQRLLGVLSPLHNGRRMLRPISARTAPFRAFGPLSRRFFIPFRTMSTLTPFKIVREQLGAKYLNLAFSHWLPLPACAVQDEGGMRLPLGECREFASLTLPNGLRVVAVSDPDTTIAGACLAVGVGNMSDPEDLPGLAHFTEHMLFLGTEKFPVEGEYKRYLLEHGGGSNASTGTERTQYHFKVQAPFLEGALARFAAFFTCPLFTASATQREVAAVESEYSKNLQLDSRRKFQLMRSLAAPGHPFNRFGSGNAATLQRGPESRGIDVRERMMQWYAQHYDAGIMTLAVCGREDTGKLLELVQEHFSAVRGNPAAHPPDFSAHGMPFKLPQCGRLVTVNPVKAVRSLHIQWPLPARPQGDLQKPHRLLSHLLGHEGEGSILASLKARGLATGLSASTASTSYASNCTVTVTLTLKGEAAWQEVVQTVYAYIAMLRGVAGAPGEPCTLPDYIWGDVRDMNCVSFAFQSPADAHSTARTLAARLQHYSPADAQWGPYAMAESLPVRDVQEALQGLVPHNSITVRTSPTWAEEADLVEPWFGARYSSRSLTEAELATWGAETAEGATAMQAHPAFGSLLLPVLEGADLGDGDMSPARWWAWPSGAGFGEGLPLHLPHKNDLLPERTSLVAPPLLPPGGGAIRGFQAADMSADKAQSALDLPCSGWPAQDMPFPMTVPCVHVGWQGPVPMRAWYVPDTHFRLPKAALAMTLHLPRRACAATPKRQVVREVFNRMLSDSLSLETYDAQLAGMQGRVSLGSSTVSMEFAGFSDKLAAFAQRMLTLASPRRLPELLPLWETHKDRLLRALANKKLGQPHNLAVELASELLVEEYAGVDASLEALQAAGTEDLEAELRLVWGADAAHDGPAFIADVAAVGDVGAASVVDTARTLASGICELLPDAGSDSSGPIPTLESFSFKSPMLQLPPGDFRFVRPHSNPADANCAVSFTWQLGCSADADVLALGSIIAQLMRQRAFDTLRTKEQLGYIVHSGLSLSAGAVLFRLRVQSAVATPAYIESRIHAFLAAFREELQTSLDSDDPLLAIAKVLRRQWLQPPKTWGAFATRALRQVASGEHDFAKALELVRSSHSLSPSAVLQFYDSAFMPLAPLAAPGNKRTIDAGLCATHVSPPPTESHQGSHATPVPPPHETSIFSWLWSGPSEGQVPGALRSQLRTPSRRLLITAIRSVHPKAPPPHQAVFHTHDVPEGQAAIPSGSSYRFNLQSIGATSAELQTMVRVVDMSAMLPAQVQASLRKWWALHDAVDASDVAHFPSVWAQSPPAPSAAQPLPAQYLGDPDLAAGQAASDP